ncbi:hypothetical protein NH44784_007361 [Achromobacter xylosoxidans NH44784-1996]|uniref:DUF1566 domain-containing protein n=1 Tax=Alcaligenes xylosoxydans xylosoxydans TaxID=85698 RepID=UPI0003320983|nr:DUF1566 domain-containing protein [Achromobacter xylosoxidans]CCH04718.1 hypothetical protein NH44784_007361 [Achromobacter xylosoxidans NH44784-1996]
MTATATTAPAIGQEWPEQGGIYIGSRLIDGATHHVIIPGGKEFDLVDVEFKDLTSALAERGEVNGHADWRAPGQEDMMLAYINVPDLFEKDDWYWTNKPCGSYDAWAVDFELGTVYCWSRSGEVRVRPVRSIIA